MSIDAKVYNLKMYRNDRKKLWLARNQKKLSNFLTSYLGKNVDVSYHDLYSLYSSQRDFSFDQVWDYQDFRDFLYDGMAASFMDDLYESLSLQKWFDAKVFSKEQILECCLSLYIMASCQKFG